MARNLKTGFKKVGYINLLDASKQSSQYTFQYFPEDANGTFFFRLKLVDMDGTFSYSKIISVNTSEPFDTRIKVTPNPILASSELNITTDEAGKLNITILNTNGREVYKKSIYIERGTNNIDLNLDHLQSGVYTLITEIKGKFKRLKLIKEN
jgi:large repetitive protein